MIIIFNEFPLNVKFLRLSSNQISLFNRDADKTPTPLNLSLLSNIRSELPIDQRTSGPSYPMSQKGRMRRSLATLRNRAHAHTRSPRVSSIQIEGRTPIIERRGNRGIDYALRVSVVEAGGKEGGGGLGLT